MDTTDKTILNLMLSKLSWLSEESEINSIIELLDIHCEGNCKQKVKSVLKEAANSNELKDRQIELKDRQIDGLITTLSSKFDINFSGGSKPSIFSDLEQTKTKNEEIMAQIISKYKDELKNANTLLDESFSLIKSFETQKQQFELQIKSYEAKIKELEDKISAENEAVEDHDKESHPDEVEIFFANYCSKMFKIENSLAGPGWLIILNLNKLNNGLWEENIIVPLHLIYELVVNRPHELYIHCVRTDKSTFYAHYDNLTLGKKKSDDAVNSHSCDDDNDDDDDEDEKYFIESMHLYKSSVKIYGDFKGQSIAEFIASFVKQCTNYQLMIREKLK
ncbi:uncharacterized protein LOC124459872 [Drosophila willistoni]|uniref:uncharacterized protein LOC124459872 n=1 Tax=Drosophila willistoni TaxID=7260 RepID=UPI001F079DE5|nr:uncharacterized protein LOC124459872 [Drosophila willistoni]